MAKIAPIGQFWMVCKKPTGPHTKSEPRKRYSTKGEAQEIAKRLAAENDHPYIVLEASEVFRPTDATQGALL